MSTRDDDHVASDAKFQLVNLVVWSLAGLMVATTQFRIDTTTPLAFAAGNELNFMPVGKPSSQNSRSRRRRLHLCLMQKLAGLPARKPFDAVSVLSRNRLVQTGLPSLPVDTTTLIFSC